MFAIVVLFAGPATPQDYIAAASAASYGVIATGECVKIGYKLDAIAWHELVGRLAPGHQPLDFGPGGKFDNIGGKTYALIIRDFEHWGAKIWCAHVREMTQRRYPDVAGRLISSSP